MRLNQLLGCLLVTLAAGASVPVSANDLYVQAGRLLNVETGKIVRGHCITVSGDRITKVARCARTPPRSKRIDWSGYTVLPGLIDLHTHLADVSQSADIALPLKTSFDETVAIGAKNALTTLRAGFTTVRDVGTYRGLSDVKLRDSINAGKYRGPRMFVSGAYITIPGGGGELNGVGPVPADMQLGVSSDVGSAAHNAEGLIVAGGVDQIKMIATGAVLAIGTEPGTQELSEAQMRAVVNIAAAHGTYATAHAHGAEGIKAAIRAGVRSVEHASLIDDEGLQMAKDKGVWLVMDIYDGDYIEAVGTAEKWPEEYLRKNRETTDIQRQGFANAVKRGVNLGYGTDAGVYPHGLNGRQFAYMVRYGMTPIQAIRSATFAAAQLLGHENEIGSLLPGHFADIIAVKGDPLRDIRVLETVAHVMKGGAVVK